MRKAVMNGDYGDLDSLTIETVPIPEPPPQHVLVKMKYAPLKSIDLFRLMGYTFKNILPLQIVGMEGVGEVVKSGGGIGDTMLGKRVGFVGPFHSFAEYACVPAPAVMPIRDGISFREAGDLFGNPMTAFCMMQEIREQNAVIISNGASSIGQMLAKMCVREEKTFIVLVRRAENVELLKSIGATHVFDITTDDWFPQAQQLSQELNVSWALDLVCGDLSGQLIDLICTGGKLCVSGNSSTEKLTVNPEKLTAGNKSIYGIALFKKLQGISPEKKNEMLEFIQDHRDTIFRSTISRVVDFEDLRGAFKDYLGLRTGTRSLVKISDDE